jgi:hypothetical protein
MWMERAGGAIAPHLPSCACGATDADHHQGITRASAVAFLSHGSSAAGKSADNRTDHAIPPLAYGYVPRPQGAKGAHMHVGTCGQHRDTGARSCPAPIGLVTEWEVISSGLH